MILSSEAIERSQETKKTKEKKKQQPEKKKVNFAKHISKHQKETHESLFYHSKHGKSSTHNTGNYYTLKNRNSTNAKLARKHFSNKSVYNKISHLCHNSTREKILD